MAVSINLNNASQPAFSDMIRDVEIIHSAYDSHTFLHSFPADAHVEDILETIARMTGSQISALELYIDSKMGESRIRITNSDTPLLGFDTGSRRIYAQDIDPTSLPNLMKHDTVTKFELTDEEYDARPNTVRRFLALNKIQRSPKKNVEEDICTVPLPTLEDRCEVVGGNRGVVKYIGPRGRTKHSQWIGIQLDEPIGSNTEGEGYFSPPPGLGFFCRPSEVQFGDFPVRDVFGSDSDEM